ncbi:transposase [Mucilaginibacter sp.]|uniref:IS110 family transposase n=1 Tax=Mucilaginibacter sp. TaxID=1882438 RepID=UPI0025DBCDC7|nr:transposase [Mucilaginibacter sp.]
MEFTYFIGADVSKNELDFSVMQGKRFLFHKEVSNSPTAIKAFIKELTKLPDFDPKQAVFCMEHTGIYTNFLLTILHEKKIAICLEAATQIKNSLGNLRGKSDKVDSLRIAEYAYKNRSELRLWQPKREILQQLAYHSAIRSRLIQVQKTIKTPLKETGLFLSKAQQKAHN